MLLASLVLCQAPPLFFSLYQSFYPGSNSYAHSSNARLSYDQHGVLGLYANAPTIQPVDLTMAGVNRLHNTADLCKGMVALGV